MWLKKAAQYLSKGVSGASKGINYFGIVILAAMMLLTAVDVIGRYVFNRPLTGSLELTEFMMVILVAFGLAYTGLQKGHIDVDIVITRLPPKTQAVINAITNTLSLGLFALITWRSVLYGESLRVGKFVSSSLFIPIYPFAYLVALGSLLLCLVFLINLLEHLAKIISGTRAWLWSILIIAVFVIVTILAIPAWQQGLRGQVTPVTAGVINIVLLIMLLFSAMPIGLVMGFLGFIGMVYIVGIGPGLTNLGTTSYSTASSYSLSVIPLFVLMGLFCFYSGLTKSLYNTAYRWIGHLPGGLAMATIGAAAGFAAVSG
ncbi:MAG: TRAP transporter small permease subunit, partial [Dehalococcoidia bacterium]|nr:TRAP transporter small permease subunit [Dehalococcoidia bacterium]